MSPQSDEYTRGARDMQELAALLLEAAASELLSKPNGDLLAPMIRGFARGVRSMRPEDTAQALQGAREAAQRRTV